MTEYITSPDPSLIFRHSKERIASWVRSHSPYLSHYHSPDSPPSVVGEVDERDSDEGSTHSLPPKMVLRYGDGRADIPISHWHYDNARREPLSRHGSHSRPHGRDYAHHTTRHPLPRAYHDDFSTPPEEIHILPSDPNVQPHRPRGTYRPRRASEPPRRQFDDEPEIITPLPPAPAPQRRPHSHSHHGHVEAPPVVYSHSQHIHYDHDHDHPHPHHSHSRSHPPPSIVYPARHVNEHYAPPTVVYSHKAPGMTHTISAPSGNGFPQYPRIVATPLQPVRSNLSSVYEDPRPYKDDSGSEGTYYVPGQKVKVLVRIFRRRSDVGLTTCLGRAVDVHGKFDDQVGLTTFLFDQEAVHESADAVCVRAKAVEADLASEAFLG